MNNELAASLTDVLLFVVTLLLTLRLRGPWPQQAWRWLFVILCGSALLGALYHGFSSLRIPAVWAVVSALSLGTAGALAIAALAQCRPDLRWPRPAAPYVLTAALTGGALLSPLPFYYVSGVGGLSVVATALAIRPSQERVARNRIYAAIAVTFVGLVLQATSPGDGLLCGNALFHYFQTGANVLFWWAARSPRHA
jgi:hypothetical protein